MKVSIITVSLNSAQTIEDTIESVLCQNHYDIEHIVIDGASTDGTVELVRSYGEKIDKFISEPDEGLYHAMNKGLKMASGQVLGTLNADDFYASCDAIQRVVDKVEKEGVDCVWGDLDYVNPKDTKRVVRRWRSCSYQEGLFQRGWMPPHPTFFVKKEVYEKYGYFNLDIKEPSADYELMLRLLEKHKINSVYLPQVLVKMRTGGASNKSLKNIAVCNIGCWRAWKMNDMRPPLFFIPLKLFRKILQLVK